MRKLKGTLQLPRESHTITQDESKEEHSGRTKGKCESTRKSETSCLDVPHLYNGVAAAAAAAAAAAGAHARDHIRVWPQSNAQFPFTGISEMFRQGLISSVFS